MKQWILILAIFIKIDLVSAWGQDMTEIHYYSRLHHTPNIVCQAKNGNIIVECGMVQDGEKVGSKLLKFDKHGDCVDSLLIDDRNKVKSFICANPDGEGDIMTSLRCVDSTVTVRIQHLNDRLVITNQTDVMMPVQWPDVFAVRFFLDKNDHLIIAFNDWQRQNYRIARIGMDGNLLDCIETTRFEQMRVTFAGTPIFQYSESPLQYGLVAMPTQGANLWPHLFILDSLFNVTTEEAITTINGANVNYSNMQAVARLNDEEWLYSCRMGLQSDGVFWNQLTKFGNPLQYQTDFRVYNAGTQGNTTCYPIPEGSVKVTNEGAIYHVCMDYLMFFPGYLNITCLNPDLSVRWQHRYPEEPSFPFGTNMCVLDNGSVVVCGYSTDNDVYDMFLLLYEDEGTGVSESETQWNQVEVYPNPGNNMLNIRTGLKDAWVEVYDMSGRMICGQEIIDNVTAINTTSWPSGSYVWKVIANGKEAESGKWIKE